MAKQEIDKDFNLDDIPSDDSAMLFGDDAEDAEDDPEEEPDEEQPANSKSKKGKKADEPGESESDEDEEQGAEDEAEDDFSDLGLDEDESGDKNPKTKKILGKFKDQKALEQGYSNLEKELGRMKNELNDLKKNPPKKDGDQDQGNQEPEKVDLLKIFDVTKLNDQLLTSDRPGEVLLVTIATAFNELQKTAVQSVTKIMDDRHKEYQSKYFDEIDQNRTAKEAAKPFVEKAAKLEKKFGDRWKTALPYMQKAIANNSDLVKEPDDYEELFERVEKYMKSKGLLEELDEQHKTAKKTGGFSSSKGRKSGDLTVADEHDIISGLLEE